MKDSASKRPEPRAFKAYGGYTRVAALLLVPLFAFRVAAQHSDPQQIFQEAAKRSSADYELAARKFQEGILSNQPGLTKAGKSRGAK